MKRKPTIALIEDQLLVRSGLKALINEKNEYRVTIEANNGQDFIFKLNKNFPPDIVLMSMHMPVMNGFETTTWIREHCPKIKVIVISHESYNEEVFNLLKSGARGFISKTASYEDLEHIISNINKHGYHLSEELSEGLIKNIQESNTTYKKVNPVTLLTEREIRFMQLASTEKTYKEIAAVMELSPRTIDSYRDQLFAKLELKNRVGLVLFAIKHGLVKN